MRTLGYEKGQLRCIRAAEARRSPPQSPALLCRSRRTRASCSYLLLRAAMRWATSRRSRRGERRAADDAARCGKRGEVLPFLGSDLPEGGSTMRFHLSLLAAVWAALLAGGPAAVAD